MDTFLSFENAALLRHKLEARERIFAKPEVLSPFLKKCSVRTLIVADGFLYFNDENFGLSDLVAFLTTTFSPYTSVVLSKAHRGNPGETRLNGAAANFVFTDQALENIDVLWLFAANTRATAPIASGEVAAIARFMNRGGGVFATGDHEDLGVAMCGRLPRVRSMRKWYWPNGGPQGEPIAPIVCGHRRYDTNRVGHDGVWQFNDQSDDIPQPIHPRFYHSRLFRQFPHPLLCGPKGRTIRVLPDHPHEGECIEPWDPSATLPIDGTFVEYPLRPDGLRELPHVIATSDMIPGTGASGDPGCPFGKPPITGGSFGAISAYDGHRAGVGRVSCDATWHHFINVNLTGDNTAFGPKNIGFFASLQGEQHLEDIKAYFRNIAIWLAPPHLQRCITLHKLLFEIAQASIVEELQIAKLRELDWRGLQHLGHTFRHVLKLNKNICEELDLPELVPWKLRDQLKFLWPIPQPDPPPVRIEIAFVESMFDTALGAAVRSLVLHIDETPVKEMTPRVEEMLLEVLDAGFTRGLEAGFEGVRGDCKEAEARLEEQLKTQPSPKAPRVKKRAKKASKKKTQLKKKTKKKTKKKRS